MKSYFFILLFSIAISISASAQKLMIGVKTPELKVLEWLGGKPSQGKKVYIIEFAHTTSPPSISRLVKLNELAKSESNLGIILLFKEEKSVVLKCIEKLDYKFSVGLDNNNKTFSSYGVNFVPFSIIIDKKGRAIWFGSSALLTNQIIKEALD